MRFPEPWRITAAAAALAMALVGLVVREGQARAAGREAALPMEAFDPRALLTGHYVDLRLSETRPEGAGCPPGTDEAEAPAGPFDEGRRGWVALSRSGRGWRVSGLARSRAEAGRLGELVVRGSASCRRMGGVLVDLDIGIRRFHADQAEAEAMERALQAGRPGEPGGAYALVSIGRDGRARLNGVEVNGRRVELEWF